jgi:formate dehydrogenase assembly factor FdhD
VCPHKLRNEPSKIHLQKQRTWYPAENCKAGSAETFANQTIPSAVASSSEVTDHDMLQRLRQELHYRLVVSRVTGGAHTEHLRLKKKLLSFPFHQY